jgi:transcriptional regulator of arginine metabolism
MTREKKLRLEAIGDLITAHPSIGTQEELVELLKKEGFETTQSSVSRDLQELGIKRVKGRYVLKPWHPVGAGDFQGILGFVQLVQRAGPNLTVVHTTPNAAKMVAEAVDNESWPEVLGTVAGEDTLFVATQNEEAQLALYKRLGQYLKR